MSDEAKPASQSDRMCPLFTATALAKDGEAVACQGAACMWYMNVQDHQGRPLPGQCAAHQIAMGMSMINLSVRQAHKLDLLRKA